MDISGNFSEKNSRHYFDGIGFGLAEHLPVVSNSEIFDACY
jgi:hypothetical protein